MRTLNKMLLVPETAYKTILNANNARPDQHNENVNIGAIGGDPLQGRMRKLESEMRAILDNRTLSDDDRYERYHQLWTRFQLLRKQLVNRNFHARTPTPQKDEPDDLFGFPYGRVREAAQAIGEHMSSLDSGFQWNDNMVLLDANQRPVLGSNIPTLLRFFADPNAKVDRVPVGAEQFARQLYYSKFDLNNLGSDNAREYVNRVARQDFVNQFQHDYDFGTDKPDQFPKRWPRRKRRRGDPPSPPLSPSPPPPPPPPSIGSPFANHTPPGWPSSFNKNPPRPRNVGASGITPARAVGFVPGGARLNRGSGIPPAFGDLRTPIAFGTRMDHGSTNPPIAFTGNVSERTRTQTQRYSPGEEATRNQSLAGPSRSGFASSTVTRRTPTTSRRTSQGSSKQSGRGVGWLNGENDRFSIHLWHK
jgi:hypothetical protein